MRFSIIVPIYNAEKYLEECIDSVINQTFKAFELILVNDGSNDNSAKVIDEYSNKYPFIKVIHKLNGGQFSARTSGIELAQGEYIIFLDSDDCLRKESLEILNQYIILHSMPDIIFHEASRKSDYSEPIINYPFEDGKVFEDSSKKELYKLFITSNNLNSMCFKAYRSELLKNVQWDVPLIISLRNGEDLMQNLPVFHKAEKIIYCNKVLYVYRYIQESVTHNYSPTYYESHKIIMRELEKYIDLWMQGDPIFIKQLDERMLKDLIYIFFNITYADSKIRKSRIKEICNDEWFRELYKRTDKQGLNWKERLFFLIAKFRCASLMVLLLKIA